MGQAKAFRIFSLLCAAALLLTAFWVMTSEHPFLQETPTTRAVLDARGAVMDGKEFLYLGAVNINVADSETLQSLPGIGKVLAQRILDYRAEHGAFATIDDLELVRGIGEKKVQLLHETAYTYKLP